MESIASIVCALIAASSAITVAVIENRVAKSRARSEKREDRRARESRLSMDMMYAACSLAMDTATAVRDGHTNGTLAENLERAQDAKRAYEDFVRDEAAHAVAKV